MIRLIYRAEDPGGDELDVGWSTHPAEDRILVQTYQPGTDESGCVSITPVQARALAYALLDATQPDGQEPPEWRACRRA